MRFGKHFGFGVALACFGMAAHCGVLPIATAAVNITPLRLDFEAYQKEGQLAVHNQAAVPLSIQVRVFAWSQEQGENRFRPSQDFIVSPSIVQIDPELTQALHVIAASNVPGGTERSYRIVIDQLPQSVGHVQDAAQTRLRMTLPLFTNSLSMTAPSLSFRLAGHHLDVANTGGHVGVLSGLQVRQGNRTIEMSQINGPPYVLAGSSITFNLAEAIDCHGPQARVSGQLDRKAFDAAAPSTCP